MCMKSERTQVLLTPRQRRRVEREAELRGVSIGAVIREAIDAHIGASATRDDAMERLFSLEAPVGDWATMKQEIVDGATS